MITINFQYAILNQDKTVLQMLIDSISFCVNTLKYLSI